LGDAIATICTLVCNAVCHIWLTGLSISLTK
jgi:hypothetical protein